MYTLFVSACLSYNSFIALGRSIPESNGNRMVSLIPFRTVLRSYHSNAVGIMKRIKELTELEKILNKMK